MSNKKPHLFKWGSYIFCHFFFLSLKSFTIPNIPKEQSAPITNAAKIVIIHYKLNNMSINSCCGNMSDLSFLVFVCVHIPFTFP